MPVEVFLFRNLPAVDIPDDLLRAVFAAINVEVVTWVPWRGPRIAADIWMAIGTYPVLLPALVQKSCMEIQIDMLDVRLAFQCWVVESLLEFDDVSFAVGDLGVVRITITSMTVEPEGGAEAWESAAALDASFKKAVRCLPGGLQNSQYVRIAISARTMRLISCLDAVAGGETQGSICVYCIQ